MTKTYTIGEAVGSLMRDGMPVRFTAYDGSSAGPPDADIHLDLLTQRGLSYIMTAPGDLGLARAYVSGDLDINGVHPGDPYPLASGATYVNVGFWGTVHVGPDAPNGPRNRAIEARVHELGGHKSLYSEAFYDPETFDQLYDGANLAAVKARYDPDDRLTSLYDKAVKRR